MIFDTNNGSASNNTISGQVTVERFIDGAQGRKWRLLTAPVQNITINKAWQDGMTMNNGSHVLSGTSTPATPETGFGTLITGGAPNYSTAGAANNAGFDFWDAIANGLASINNYAGNPDWKQARWIPETTTKNIGFDAHQAYLLFVRGDRFQTATTTSNNTVLRPKGLLKEDLEHKVAVHATNSHTLVGNPYASPLDFKKIYGDNKPSIQPYFWIWQASLTASWGGYAVIRPQSVSSSEYEMIPYGASSGTKVEPVISSGQGFFVIPAAPASSATLTIKQNHKSGNNSAISVFRETGEKPKKLFVNVYMPAVNGGEEVLLDGVLAEFTSDDKKTGIGKMLQSVENLSVLKNNQDQIVSVDDLPKVGDKVQLKLWNTTVRDYRMRLFSAQFTVPGITAVLVDKFLNKETPLTPGDASTTYDFRITADGASKDPLRFYIVFQAAPLPAVKLEAVEKRNGVQLHWTVQEEKTVLRYELERSTDGTTFTTITTAQSRGGAAPQRYGHFDKEPAMSNHYRVKSTGITGAVGYSNVVKLELAQTTGFTLYPNPVTANVASLQFTGKSQGRYITTLYTTAGQRVLQQVIQHNGGTATYTLMVANLAGGTYTLEVEQPNGKKEKIPLVLVR